MHVFFEDDGQLKAGTVLADNDTSLQVESVSGKRLKIKAAAVLLRFAEPSPAALGVEAQKLAHELDPNFLWEVSGDDEFGFADLAREYYGHPPTPAEAAAVALALAAAPMFFYKRGKGRYRKALPDALKAALASIERKQREAEQMAAWGVELRARRTAASAFAEFQCRSVFSVARLLVSHGKEAPEVSRETQDGLDASASTEPGGPVTRHRSPLRPGRRIEGASAGAPLATRDEAACECWRRAALRHADERAGVCPPRPSLPIMRIPCAGLFCAD